MSVDAFTVLGVGEFGGLAGRLAAEIDAEEPQVRTVPDAERAGEALRAGPVDCVVCAQSLPGDRGDEFLRRVRESRPDLPFVLVGEGVERSVASAAVDAGVTGYVPPEPGEGQLRVLARRVEAAANERRVPGATDRVERDRALTETERVLRKAFEYARDAIMIIDPENDAIRRVNPAACELLGYDREELLATPPEAIHPDEVETFREFVGSVLDEGEGWTDELTCRTSDGTALPAEISASAIRLEGRPHVLAIVRDVTDRKVYEHRLEALNELSRELMTVNDAETIARRVVAVAQRVLDHPLTAVWAYDPADECLVPLAATDAATKLSDGSDGPGGVPAIPDGTFEMRVFREGETREVEDYGAIPDAAHPETPLETILMVPMGEHGVLHVGSRSERPFQDSERYLVEILARVAEGAFDRVERVRELELRNERLEEFASVVSHDLRNPLEIAKGYLEQARRTGEPEHFDETEAALDHMEALIDDVLTLARQGETVSEFEPVDLRRVAVEAWSIAGEDGATLDVDPELGRIACDPDRVRQLLGNLFANAVDHAGPGVTVVVGGLPDGFYVADDGPGIPPGDRETVFESGETEDPDGTGFGLAIVRRIAEAHGWSVRATDSEEGGARFEVTGVDRA